MLCSVDALSRPEVHPLEKYGGPKPPGGLLRRAGRWGMEPALRRESKNFWDGLMADAVAVLESGGVPILACRGLVEGVGRDVLGNKDG